MIKDKIFYLIANESDMTKYLLNKNSKNYNTKRNYILSNNIDWNKINNNFHNPIESFDGIFDGNNFKIKNIKIKSNYQDKYVGLFDLINNSTIKNLKLQFNTKIKGDSKVGALAGLITNSNLFNIQVNGNVNIETLSGETLGFLCGEMKDSYVNNFNIDLENSSIKGLRNIGAFVAKLIKSEIKNSTISGSISIIGLTNYNSDSYYNKYIETIDDFFKIYTNYNQVVLEDVTILKNADYNYEKLMNNSLQNMVKLGIDPKRALEYGKFIKKERLTKYYSKELKEQYKSSEISGFISNSIDNTIINSKVCLVGSIIGYEYISGFVSNDSSSIFKNCNMEIIGCLEGINYTSLFCSNADKKSIFNNIRINKKTKINDILVDINNISQYKKIANTDYILNFKESVYPESYKKILFLDKELIKRDTIIYQIFDFVLTSKQLESLKLTNVLLRTENTVLLSLKELFEKKWDNLSETEKNNFENIGFNKVSFDNIDFPDIMFNNFTKKQRLYALKVGFNQIIWDNKYVQKVMTFNNNYDFSKFYGLKINLRHILNFSINIDNLIIKLPNYIKDIILIEMKKYLINYFETHLINNKSLNDNNLKIYYKDENNLDFVVILNHIENYKEKDGINFIDEYYIKDSVLNNDNFQENNEEISSRKKIFLSFYQSLLLKNKKSKRKEKKKIGNSRKNSSTNGLNNSSSF